VRVLARVVVVVVVVEKRESLMLRRSISHRRSFSFVGVSHTHCGARSSRPSHHFNFWVWVCGFDVLWVLGILSAFVISSF
jgi:hypothetical protein